MKTIEEIKNRHEKELREAEQKLAIAAILPAQATHVHVYKDYVYVTYSKPYPERYTFRQAYELFKLFSPVESEHWKSGCLSCQPAEINKYAKEERAVMDGASIAEIKLSAGKGYDSHALTFWARIGATLLHVSIDLRPPWKWLPQTEFRYDVHGNCTKSRVLAVGIGEDSVRKWWSPEGSYQLSYYWADVPSFDSFASTVND